MSASDRRLAKLSSTVALVVAAVVALGIVSFVVVLTLSNVGDHSVGITNVSTTP